MSKIEIIFESFELTLLLFSVTIDENSHHWIGNWWLGYLVFGLASTIMSLPITLFPKSLPNTARYRQHRENEIHQIPEAIKAKGDANFGKR